MADEPGEGVPPFVPLSEAHEAGQGADGSYRMARPRRAPRPHRDDREGTQAAGGEPRGGGPGALTSLALALALGALAGRYAVAPLYAPLIGQDPWALAAACAVLAAVLLHTLLVEAKRALDGLVEGVARFQRRRMEAARARMRPPGPAGWAAPGGEGMDG